MSAVSDDQAQPDVAVIPYSQAVVPHRMATHQSLTRFNTPPSYAPDPPPPPPEIANTIWPTIEAEVSPAHQAALRWWLAGYSWRESAGLAGFKNHVRVREMAFRYGLQKYYLRSDRLIKAHREIASQASELVLERLEDEDERKKIPFRDLALSLGLSTDKISDYERWNNRAQDDSGILNGFEALAKAIAEGNVSFELKVTANRNGDTAIDVTPGAAEMRDSLPERKEIREAERLERTRPTRTRI